MSTHCILTGGLGWTNILNFKLRDLSLETTSLPKVNGFIVYNTTKKRLEEAVDKTGFGGGTITEFTD